MSRDENRSRAESLKIRLGGVCSVCQCVSIKCLMGLESIDASAVAIPSRETEKPESTRSFPSPSVNTAMFPPDPARCMLVFPCLPSPYRIANLPPNVMRQKVENVPGDLFAVRLQREMSRI